MIHVQQLLIYTCTTLNSHVKKNNPRQLEDNAVVLFNFLCMEAYFEKYRSINVLYQSANQLSVW